MGCATTGELRSYLDGELAGAERDRVRLHLASCAACQTELDTLRRNSSIALSALDLVKPSPAEMPSLTWSQVRAREGRRENSPVTFLPRATEMIRRVFDFGGNRGMRAAATTIAALLVVAMLFTLSPVQTAASSFLSIFRVKNFTAVSIDPATLPDLEDPGNLGTFEVTGDREIEKVSAGEVAARVGFEAPVPSAMPAGFETEPRLVAVKDAFSVSYTPDMEKVRAYLSSIGASDVNLPEELDGATITTEVPASVTVLYAEKGEMERGADGLLEPAAGQKFLYIGAANSPTINAPDGVDVNQLRSEFLKIPGLPQDLVDQLSGVDLESTVVVPVVKGTSKEVQIQGEDGLLISEDGSTTMMLLWEKDGRVYGMTGNVSEQELLDAANSL